MYQPSLDIAAIRQQFPILNQPIHGKPLVYLDSAASAQKPQVVIDAISNCYSTGYANIHRGVHSLSERATAAFETTRQKVARFINAPSTEQIIFTRGATEAINLVAQSFGRSQVRSGDRILISAMEHHANIVPWQMLCDTVGAHLDIIPINQHGELILDDLDQYITARTKLVAITHISNSLGTINPIQTIIAAAHAQQVPVLLDGAQSIVHTKIDVQDLDVDFFVFSGHKLYGPTGVGILYGKRALLEAMPPWQGGGDMIAQVTFTHTTYADLPYKFEAGTPDIANVIGFAAALDWVEHIGISAIAAHEADLLAYADQQLATIPQLHIIGCAAQKAGLTSFVLDDIHPHDIGTFLDFEGIAVRVGHHCAQPVMQFFNVPATVRASFAVYNTRQEIDLLVAGLSKVRHVFG